MKLFLFLLMAAFTVQPNGTPYYVDNTNPAASNLNAGTDPAKPWSTVGNCAAKLVADDSCNAAKGAYDENVTPRNSGTPGHPIVYSGNGLAASIRRFTLTGKKYITVYGWDITNAKFAPDTVPNIIVTGSYGVRIVGNHIHDSTSNSAAIKSSLVSCGWLYVGSNTIERIGLPGNRMVGVELKCDNSLVEKNGTSGTQDFARMFGYQNVIRLENWHDSPAIDAPNAHIDGFQSFCSGGLPNVAANQTLIEGNTAANNPGPDEHFALINATLNCGGAKHMIVRGNTVSDVGESTYTVDLNSQGPSSYHKFYGNTVVRVGRSACCTSTVYLTGATHSSVLNNIFSQLVLSTTRKVYSLRAGDPTSGGDYNLAFMASAPVSWAAPIGTEPHGVRNKDPLFVSANDFRLQPGSPAIAAGGPLTYVAAADTLNGINLVLADAYFFQPGWAGTLPDVIAVGSATNTAAIVSINYGTNTVTLAAGIPRKTKDPVWLYKNSSGAVMLNGSAPNIGAFQ